MKTVLLLCGGRSDEHEISLISAKCILDAMDTSRFTPIVVGIAKDGKWHLEEIDSFFVGEFRADSIRLNTDTPLVTLAPYTMPNGRGRLDAQGRILEFDVVFPILHGQFGEDGTLQGMLELAGLPFVGSGCGSSWICMDKVFTKTICQRDDIAVAEFAWVRSKEELESVAKTVRGLGLPLFVKPSRQGSSVGVSKVTSWDQLPAAVEFALKYDTKCLIERGIQGREIECAILGLNHQARASLPGEIIPSKKVGWYSYEAKYLLKDGAETKTPAALSPHLTESIRKFCLRIFDLLECDGMARVDLFVEEGTERIYLNEVNTLPGFTPISMYPKMWEVSGLAYKNLITELIDLAFQRQARR